MKRLLSIIITVIAAAPAFGQQPTAQRGQVLLLKSLRAFDGEIQRQGDFYRIKRGSGELSLPADQALLLCADWEHAFAFVSSRANLRDPDERIRLAKWCQANGLFKQAIHEVGAALEMRPNDPKAKHLKEILQRQSQATPPTATALPKTKVATPTPTPFVDVDTPTLAVFTTRVQPILMNACIRCHSHGDGGRFQLIRTTLGSRRSVTQRNLASVLQFIDRAEPEQSPLLAKAITAHGSGNRPPLKGKTAPAYLWMQQWTKMLLVNNPHFREEIEKKPEAVAEFKSTGAKGINDKTADARALPFQSSDQKPEAPRRIDITPALQSAKELQARPVPLVPNLAKEPAGKARSVIQEPAAAIVQTSAKQPQTTESADPYDPADFNRVLHPDTTPKD